MPDAVGRDDAVGLGDHVAAGAEVDVVLGERGRGDLEADAVPGVEADGGIPQGDRDLVHLAGGDRLGSSAAVAVAEPHHAVAEALREPARVHVDELGGDVGVPRAGGDVGDNGDRAGDFQRFGQGGGGVDEDVAAAFEPEAVVGAADLGTPGAGGERHRVVGVVRPLVGRFPLRPGAAAG